MNVESLIASAAINMGLAILFLTLFSIFKKQPANAVVYFPRQVLKNKTPTQTLDESFTLGRLIPSATWISRAFKTTEDEIISSSGLDSLVLLRLFVFSIKLFIFCTIIGIFILVPINYTDEPNVTDNIQRHSLDSFTISNVRRGSNRLWVHFACLYIISFAGFYLLYKEYSGISRRRINQLNKTRPQPDQFTTLVRAIPPCNNHGSYGQLVEDFFSKFHPSTYLSHKMAYDGRNIQRMLKEVEKLSTWIEKLQKETSIGRLSKNSGYFGPQGTDNDQLKEYKHKLKTIYERIKCCQSEVVLKQKELPVAFVTFRSRWGAAVAAQTQQTVDPMNWVTEWAPEPRDVSWHNLSIPYSHLVFHKIGVAIAVLFLTVFFAVPVTAVQGLAQFDKIKEWFPPIKALLLIPGLRSILTGYLPSVILNIFIYIIPFAMLLLADIEGCVSTSSQERKACSMVFYFLVANVFFLSLLSGSLLDQIGESFTNPRNIPNRLASAVSAQADFFITYILTTGLAGFPLEILQLGLLLWHLFKVHSFGRGQKHEPYIYSIPYYRIIPNISLFILIGMTYAMIAPLLLPFLLVYLFLGYFVCLNQVVNVYEPAYDTSGQFWPQIHHYLIVSFILMQVTLVGFFGLKQKPTASILTIPLPIITLLFNEYCKQHFFPAFRRYSVQSTMEKDKDDEKNGLKEEILGCVTKAYLHPALCSANNIVQQSNNENLISLMHDQEP